jgi:hypothetical protein
MEANVSWWLSRGLEERACIPGSQEEGGVVRDPFHVPGALENDPERETWYRRLVSLTEGISIRTEYTSEWQAS